ncbi:YrdB family protein [Rummeliibacillus sp. NPDC094406]|uniref:YrdB family protein n=1 Tax=Rummeliibacillus sp. NPDC094406 TaxID=3364511 RepID=UPI0037FB65E3
MVFLTILEMMNLGLRFILELTGLILYGYWGFQTGNTHIQKGILSISIPLSIAVIWALFGSPKANIPLPATAHFILEMIIFLLPVLLLISLGKVAVACVYGLIFILNKILLVFWHS